MIECLSNPEWINPQMDFLVYLQNIRINCADIYDKFFLCVTTIGEYWLPTLICAIVYWCIDFRAGIYLFSLEGFNKLFAYLFKMLGCVYRPWILDNRIHPSPLAIPFATGYSFPSGHSAMSSSVLGGCAYLLRKYKFLCLLLICLIFIVGFSRLWLGVHSPQDVIVGLLIGFILVFAMNGLIKWAEKDSNRYILLLVIVDILAFIVMIYLYYFNTYRMDYVLGKLLVDPQGLKTDALITYSFSLGLINGCFLCAKFSPFNPKDVSIKRRVVRGLVGGAGLILLLKFALEQAFACYFNVPCSVSLAFLIGLTITLIYPVIFTKLKNL